VEVKAYKIL